MSRPGLVASVKNAWAERSVDVRKAILAYLDELYRFALRLTRDAEHARELIQECVLKALKTQKSDIRDPRNWLFQTVYHTFVDDYRKGVLRASHEGDSSDEETQKKRIVDQLPSMMAMEDVRNALENLPEPYRAVVWLSDAEEVPLREIAVILGCPLGTVASRLARGRQELRRLLSAYGQGEEEP
jgi:RNA polymerase sigma-70 factor, ECF subfamily